MMSISLSLVIMKWPIVFFFHTAVLEYFLIALTRIWNFFCILITSFRVSLSSRSSPLDENCTETVRNALLRLKNSLDWNFLCISFLRCPLYYSVYEIGCYISNNGLKLFRKKKLRAIHWIVIYPLDNAIHLLNNQGQVKRHLFIVSSCTIVCVRVASLDIFHDDSQYGRRCHSA